jgi:hypothetical protein
MVQAAFAGSPVVEQSFTFSIKTADVDSVFQKIIQAVEAKGGYFTHYDNRSLSLRLPVGELPEFQKILKSLAEITDKDFSNTDMTTELEKLNLKIQSRKKLLETYFNLAKNAPFAELQSVEREMVSLNSQIESLQGEKLSIEKNAALVSITIDISEVIVPGIKAQSSHSPFVWIRSTNLKSLRKEF